MRAFTVAHCLNSEPATQLMQCVFYCFCVTQTSRPCAVAYGSRLLWLLCQVSHNGDAYFHKSWRVARGNLSVTHHQEQTDPLPMLVVCHQKYTSVWCGKTKPFGYQELNKTALTVKTNEHRPTDGNEHGWQEEVILLIPRSRKKAIPGIS